MDTDSFIVHVKTDDIYKDIKDVEKLQIMTLQIMKYISFKKVRTI